MSCQVTSRRLVCVVNNYNYERFLAECLDSALGQTRGFDMVIVVDDGSSDGSRALIDEYRARHANITAIYKPNGGQLSCFNAAASLVADGDLVFFLDADDVYPANYVAELLKVADAERADFYFCKAVAFRNEQERIRDAVVSDEKPMVLPLSSATVLVSRRWIGSPTSALAVSGRLYRQILPYPFEYDWVTRADDVVVNGASVLGARKVFVRSLGIGYRVHGSNLFTGNAKVKEPREKRLHLFRVERLLNVFSVRAGVRREPSSEMLYSELELLDDEVKVYFGIKPAAYYMRRRFRKTLKRWKRIIIRRSC